MTYSLRFVCRKVSLALCFLLFIQVIQAQTDFSPVDAKIAQYQKQLGKEAIVMVYKDNKVIYQKALGEFMPATQVPVWASSQWFTVALVLTYVEEGKLSLDDPVTKYLPVFGTYMKSYVTVRQCLEHTLGFQSEKGEVRHMGGAASLEEEVNSIASRKEIEFKPGEAYFYTNQGLNIAGRILEVVSKKPFDRIAQDRLFRPLGMKNTSFSSERAVIPSEGALSSALDYLHFEQMLLDKGMYNGKRILSETVVADLLKARPVTASVKYTPKLTTGLTTTYGGWVLDVDAQQQATSVACPSLSGIWPVVDTRNHYSLVVFVKSAQGEQKKEMYLDIKAAVDQVLDSVK